MKHDWFDWLGFFLIGLMALIGIGLLGALGYKIWFDATHHCVKKAQIYVPESTTYVTVSTDPWITMPIIHEGHYAWQCTVWEKDKMNLQPLLDYLSIRTTLSFDLNPRGRYVSLHEKALINGFPTKDSAMKFLVDTKSPVCED